MEQIKSSHKHKTLGKTEIKMGHISHQACPRFTHSYLTWHDRNQTILGKTREETQWNAREAIF